MASPSPPRPSQLGWASSDDTVQTRDDYHQHRRRFIGPLPKQQFAQDVVNNARQKKRHGRHGAEAPTLDDADDEERLKDAVYNLALDFLRRHKGAEGEWGENEERSMREGLYKRWKETEWGRAYLRSKTSRTDKKWIGTSFDVGVFLGINALAVPSGKAKEVNGDAEGSSRHVAPATAVESFVTAPSRFARSQSQLIATPSQHREDSLAAHVSGGGDDESQSAHSSTALLKSNSHVQGGHIDGASQHSVSHNDNTSKIAPTSKSNGAADKGKGKMVHYPDTIMEEGPAPPADVLIRSGKAVEHTSAGAAQEAEEDDHVVWGDVVMRDRAYVKFSYSRLESLPAEFDEWQNRTTSHLYNEDWAEYILLWRKNRLELYKNHNTPGKDWLTGHLKLVFIIPLGQSTTRLSLYSFVDMTFCVVCPPARLKHRSKRRWLHNQKRGLNIFVFNFRSRTRAVDWYWRLWRHLGGQLPPSLEIRSPLLDTRIEIDMPDREGLNITAAYRVFTLDNVLELCVERLTKVAGHELEKRITSKADVALAWRSEINLDWVWQSEDVQGHPRKWAVLCGLALNQHAKPAHLEVRLKEHFPTRLHLKDGTRLDEPPAVEGYLDRIRINSQIKQSLYLTTHNGYLFSLAASQAHHPPPPGFLMAAADSQPLLQAEIERGTQQILHATGMLDLRSIAAVRRAFQLIPRHSDEEQAKDTADGEDTKGFWDPVERSDSDDEDLGGDVGTGMASDKNRLRIRRSFELLLTTGNVVRFEAYSCQTALEWIVRLRALVSYWRKRHQADAQTEMRLAYHSTGRPRITPLQHVFADHDAPPEPLPDTQTPLPDLSTLFNWCVLDSCRPIIKSGKIFARKGLWGQYRHVQMVLVTNTLIQYRITGRKSLHHHQLRSITLLDAYICSGYLAAQYLPEGQYDPDVPHVARRYGDGLETDDGIEDTLFMIWYRGGANYASGSSAAASGDPPKLAMKRQLAFFRTRSKLERDAWVWAINMEIERGMRTTREREEVIREADNIGDA